MATRIAGRKDCKVLTCYDSPNSLYAALGTDQVLIEQLTDLGYASRKGYDELEIEELASLILGR